jgi:hypothetical protein
MPTIREVKRQRAEELGLQKDMADRVEQLEKDLEEVKAQLEELKERLPEVEVVDEDAVKEPKATKTSSRTTSK